MRPDHLYYMDHTIIITNTTENITDYYTEPNYHHYHRDHITSITDSTA